MRGGFRYASRAAQRGGACGDCGEALGGVGVGWGVMRSVTRGRDPEHAAEHGIYKYLLRVRRGAVLEACSAGRRAWRAGQGLVFV